MRLKSIRLAGFKSFVDPTNIPIAGNLIGVVGPNGCGKSNIIDAVRWVMGESSASRLRGDSMADVIFNGSNGRKPVGKASIELVFDNSEGRAGGQYATYNEISIRREAGRDGQSDYFLNKTRCRRKDITDLFLGTGLGPRAYSIIEQGMVTRIIESKPEDLRGFIEEAAGISRYKERRRETESRITHTRENLARVEDIRQELATQLHKLHRQSKTATRYKAMKQEEREVRAQLYALRYRELDQKLTAQESAIRQHQTTLEAALAEQRGVEARIESLRSEHADAWDKQNAVQGEHYTVGTEITRLEQAIEHARATRTALGREHEQLNRAWDEATEHLDADRRQFEDITQRIEVLAPELARHQSERAAAATELDQAEDAMAAWQEEWDAFGVEAADATRAREVQASRVHQIEAHLTQLQERQQRLLDEASAIEAEIQSTGLDAARVEASAIDAECARIERALDDANERVRAARVQREGTNTALDARRGEQQAATARLNGLRELQAAAETGDDGAVADWLRRHELHDAPRLARRLQVDAGWETAVERALGAARLGAVCVPQMFSWTPELAALQTGRLALVDLSAARTDAAPAAGTLLAKIRSDIDLAPLLAGVYVAEDLVQALVRRADLEAHESIITRDGAWIGRNWLSLETAVEGKRGWLARAREIDQLDAHTEALAADVETLQSELAQALAALETGERERDDLAKALADTQRARAERREHLGLQQERLHQFEARSRKLEGEREELRVQIEHDEAEVENARVLAREAEANGATHEERRARLQQRRHTLQEQLAQVREQEAAAGERLHELEIDHKTLETSLTSIRASSTRIESQLDAMRARRDELIRLLAEDQHPEIELKRQLDGYLSQQLAIDERLADARRRVADLDAALREHEQSRQQFEQRVEEARSVLEAERVARQELAVRRDTLSEQLLEIGADPALAVGALLAEATEVAWSERLEQLSARIEKLGPINLVAIEEFEELSTRKGFLDKQFDDLAQALSTLEEAIRKMDRETRACFKETFDKVNENFRLFFPRLFGGGSAYLETTDNDLLETGVSVMARPPGKRNSTIHLLSGGEKALTAVALLFAIFELNPAPFCLLDEVDAPLDDANVARYCETLKTISARTQLLFVTHNKISMELAEILIGVTMSEPGVSRLVAVDVDEAMRMVAQ